MLYILHHLMNPTYLEWKHEHVTSTRLIFFFYDSLYKHATAKRFFLKL
jgi:hypothetical protein